MDDQGAAPLELGTVKIGKLLKTYAVPGIIAQTAASLYNIIDSIYIGHIPGVGSSAISGLAVTFPLMNLAVALGTLVGIGATTMVSVLLGQKNYGTANKVLSNVLTLNVIIGAGFTIATLPFLDRILFLFGASESTLPFARDYMTIILLGNVFTHLYFGFNGIIRAGGHPKTAMGLTLFSVVSNSILDPIFIFALDMGIKGAALATILCQIAALVYTIRFLADKNRFLHFPRPLFQLDWRIAKQTLAIGTGPFLMNCAACIVSLFINQQLRKYGGDLAIGAYGILNRFTMFFVMICFGFNQGLQPIAGYNYGARQYKRVKEVFWLTLKWQVIVTSVCFLICEFAPGFAVGLFTNDEELSAMAIKALRIANCGFAFVGIGIVTSNFFQCLGMVGKSVFLSLSRQLLFLVPLLYSLPLAWGQNGVWWSFPISDMINVIVSAILIFITFKKFSKLNDGDEPNSISIEIK